MRTAAVSTSEAAGERVLEEIDRRGLRVVSL